MAYTPRKCSLTGRLIAAKDHSSVQINVGNVTKDGVYNKTSKTLVVGGYLRKTGEADQRIYAYVLTF
jgi:small subunit ribosomal protein S21e